MACEPSDRIARTTNMRKKPVKFQHSHSATLYYDGACPLCSAEIGRLARLAGPDLCLVDIHAIDKTGSLPGKEALLRNLHYIREDGRVLTGIDANVAAWQHTRFGVLWRWLSWPWLRPLTSRVYAFWAHRRFRKLYGAKGEIE